MISKDRPPNVLDCQSEDFVRPENLLLCHFSVAEAKHTRRRPHGVHAKRLMS